MFCIYCFYFIFFFFFLMIRRPPRSTLSLHDALPIFHVADVDDVDVLRLDAGVGDRLGCRLHDEGFTRLAVELAELTDRKSTRLNSSHANISYAVFCLKKKKKKNTKSTSLRVYTYAT